MLESGFSVPSAYRLGSLGEQQSEQPFMEKSNLTKIVSDLWLS